MNNYNLKNDKWDISSAYAKQFSNDLTQCLPYQAEWSSTSEIFRFADGNCSGSVHRSSSEGIGIVVEDIITEESPHRVHRVEMSISRGGENFQYSILQVSEQEASLFGSCADYGARVIRDQKKANLDSEERRMLETLPDAILKQIILSAI